MRIVLVRHGKPDVEKYTSGEDGSYREWLKKYNAAGINKLDKPPAELVKLIGEFDVVLSSDLKRAVDSAQALANGKEIIKDKVFREFELPESKRKLPRFSPGVWSLIFRILWFTGYSNKSENFSDAKERIRSSADKLIELSEDHSGIVLIGHGLMNRFIGRELIKRGWKKHGRTGSSYWGFSEYIKKT